jgi:hypothetical protein
MNIGCTTTYSMRPCEFKRSFITIHPQFLLFCYSIKFNSTVPPIILKSWQRAQFTKELKAVTFGRVKPLIKIRTTWLRFKHRNYNELQDVMSHMEEFLVLTRRIKLGESRCHFYRSLPVCLRLWFCWNGPSLILNVYYFCFFMAVSAGLDWIFGGGLSHYFRSFFVVYSFDQWWKS